MTDGGTIKVRLATTGKMFTVKFTSWDRYSRTIAHVILPDGRDLGQILVGEGLAWWYRRNPKNDTKLEHLETDARESRRGLWTDPEAVAPWRVRKNK